MIRIATVLIVICMALIAAAFGVVLHVAAGLDPVRAAASGAAALAAMVLHLVVTERLRRAGRDEDSGQTAHLAELSSGVGDLARQVSDFGRRLSAIEHRVVAADLKSQHRVETMLGEIGELGALVRQLAVTVAEHEDALSGFGAAPAPVNDDIGAGTDTASSAAPPVPPADAATRAALAGAIEEGRIDIHLQPLVTLPQRKVRFYEAVARLRTRDGDVLAAERFIPAAEAMGLIEAIDTLVVRRALKVLRRLTTGNQDIGLFCNVAAATLADPAAFAAFREVLETHRALAPALVLEFRHDDLRTLGPVARRHLGTLAGYGYRFSVDHVSDLRIKPRDLAERGVRFVKVPAALLLDESQEPSTDIHPADLADLLGRFGIDLIAEHIEGERAVVDLLDYEVRFGQGHLFAPPRPLRPDQAAASAAPEPAARTTPSDSAPRGTAALLRRAAGGRGVPRP